MSNTISVACVLDKQALLAAAEDMFNRGGHRSPAGEVLQLRCHFQSEDQLLSPDPLVPD